MLPGKKSQIGVIVGRFQVNELHKGHKALIDYVRSRHPKVIIFLGLSPIKCTFANPLDFETRKKMIQQEYPDVNVLYIKDCKSDKIWSNKLDEMIDDLKGPHESALLYGGRDSFINHYTGKFPTKELKQNKFVSGSDIRFKISQTSKTSKNFRTGVIYATMHQYPTAIPTVDVAIFNDDYTEILLGRKEQEKEFRFIGGFVTPGDTWEQTVRRETFEETNLEITGIQYVKSFYIDDWRYKKEIDKITTSLFTVKILSGRPVPGDDIFELKWFKFNDVNVEKDIVQEHREMFNYLKKFKQVIPDQISYHCKQCGTQVTSETMIWWVGDIYCSACYNNLEEKYDG